MALWRVPAVGGGLRAWHVLAPLPVRSCTRVAYVPPPQSPSVTAGQDRHLAGAIGSRTPPPPRSAAACPTDSTPSPLLCGPAVLCSPVSFVATRTTARSLRSSAALARPCRLTRAPLPRLDGRQQQLDLPLHSSALAGTPLSSREANGIILYHPVLLLRFCAACGSQKFFCSD